MKFTNGHFSESIPTKKYVNQPLPWKNCHLCGHTIKWCKIQNLISTATSTFTPTLKLWNDMTLPLLASSVLKVVETKTIPVHKSIRYSTPSFKSLFNSKTITSQTQLIISWSFLYLSPNIKIASNEINNLLTHHNDNSSVMETSMLMIQHT